MDEVTFIKATKEMLHIEKQKVAALENILVNFSSRPIESGSHPMLKMDVTEIDFGNKLEMKLPDDNTGWPEFKTKDEKKQPKLKKHKSWKIDDDRLRELFADEKTDIEIAEILDRTAPTIAWRRTVLGLKKPRNNASKRKPKSEAKEYNDRHTETFRNKVVALLNEGKTNTEIINKLGKNRWKISTLINEIQSQQDLTSMIDKTVIENGVVVQKLKPGYAHGGSSISQRRY